MYKSNVSFDIHNNFYDIFTSNKIEMDIPLEKCVRYTFIFMKTLNDKCVFLFHCNFHSYFKNWQLSRLFVHDVFLLNKTLMMINWQLRLIKNLDLLILKSLILISYFNEKRNLISTWRCWYLIECGLNATDSFLPWFCNKKWCYKCVLVSQIRRLELCHSNFDSF